MPEYETYVEPIIGYLYNWGYWNAFEWILSLHLKKRKRGGGGKKKDKFILWKHTSSKLVFDECISFHLTLELSWFEIQKHPTVCFYTRGQSPCQRTRITTSEKRHTDVQGNKRFHSGSI